MNSRISVIIWLFLSCVSYCEDGSIDPNCTKEKACQSNYTASIRPPVSYMNHLKASQLGVPFRNESLSQEETTNEIQDYLR